jgi:hypothetical protein
MCFSLSNIISVINSNICMGGACSMHGGDAHNTVVLNFKKIDKLGLRSSWDNDKH